MKLKIESMWQRNKEKLHTNYDMNTEIEKLNCSQDIECIHDTGIEAHGIHIHNPHI